jgi:UDP-glucose 4-epimerase
MRILVTGGAGFIGSHLIDTLIKRRNKIICLDDLSTGSLSNIKHLKKNRNFYFELNSILNRRILNKLVRECDVVIHLAASVGVRYVIENPLRALIVNTRGTESLLELCHHYSKKILFASTSEIYGKNKKIPMREGDDRVLGSTEIGRWGYSTSKAFDEFLAFAYKKEKRLPVVVMRFFNISGPRQRPDFGMVMPTFVKQALSNEKLTIYGSGRQTRTFAHVYDAVSAITGLLHAKNTVGRVFNVGGEKEITISALAKRIIKLTKSKSKIKYIPYKKAFKEDFEDMPRRVPDLGRIRKTIGYRPSYSLDEIIRDTSKYIMENHCG